MIPNYREARPKLDILEVQKAYFDERLICLFEGPDHFRGEVLILGIPETELTLHYVFTGRGFLTESETAIALDHAPTRSDFDRHFFRCPRCDQRKKTIWFDVRWACGECHGLRYHSQSLPGPQRIYQRNLSRYEALRAKLADGRPHRMRNATYEALCHEREELREWLLQNPRKLASRRQRALVTHRWLRASERTEPLLATDYICTGNFIDRSPWCISDH